MENDSRMKVEELIKKGVQVPEPRSIMIGADVDPDRIAAKGVIIYPGCKILGRTTLIMEGARLGYEAPVTLEDCQLGPNVDLGGGFFRKSAFLDRAGMGSGAQVREASIVEEQAKGAHCVGLKQTVLFPFVTLGSLINFCDCLMAGGDSPENHSEVGSSYIHFNYTPNQDKATASLIGDVPRGVMLNQAPIFLGGQGGLVGPVRIEYGTVIAAGVVCRKDTCEQGRLVLGQGSVDRDITFRGGLYWYVKRLVFNNTNYVANLIALRHWYERVRSQFVPEDPMGHLLHEGALGKLDMAIEERLTRFRALAEKMPASAEQYRSLMKEKADEKLLKQKEELNEQWQNVEALFREGVTDPGDMSQLDPFLETITGRIREKGRDYIAVIQGLDRGSAALGTRWLQGIVDGINHRVLGMMPSCNRKST